MKRLFCHIITRVLLGGILAAGSLIQARAAEVTVEIINFSFSPATVTIQAGDTVIWVQRDPIAHTSTSGPPGNPDGIWNSGLLNQGQTFQRTFDTAGTFPYFCIPHPQQMIGSVTVEGGGGGGTPPTVVLMSPTNNAQFAEGASITIEAQATATGATVSQVEFLDGATSLGVATNEPFTLTVTLPVGTHSLTATVTDSTGATATSEAVTVTVTGEGGGGTPPTVMLMSPTNNAQFAEGASITIEAHATATGATVSQVEFLDGATSLGVATNEPFTLTVTLPVGTHSLTATVTDSTGATATSEAVTVTVTGEGTGGGEEIADPFPAPIVKAGLTVELETVADGLISPLGLASPDDGSGRMFVYDQAGLVYVIANGTKLEAPLLDVSGRLVTFGNYDERGLLGLATHPGFAEQPLIYTYTSEPVSGTADFTTDLRVGDTNNHQSVIAEWRIDAANTNQVDVSSRREILRIDQPQGNHNGGTMRFGQDGFLYISLGDGGAADDQGPGHVTGGNGQSLTNIYGKVIRIDVNGRTSANGQYAVPADNPFVGADGLDEIYAYGFRNPYTFSFDRMTGELYVADVGQNKVEELNRVFRGGNYGWPIKEGDFYFDANGTNAGFITSVPVRDVPADLIDPIAQYDHDEGLAIVSGFVYRGSALPALIGRYVAGDWGSFQEPTGRLFFLDHSEFRELRIGRDDRPFGLWLKGIGEDASGELYVFASTNLGPSGTSGRMLKLVPAASNLEITETSMTSTNVSLTWANGLPPFAVQSSGDLGGAWMNAAVTTNSTAAATASGDQAFYRVAELGSGPAIPFSVILTGAGERPEPVQTTASGFGILSLIGNVLHFDIRYGGLASPASNAHIHGPASAEEAAGVQVGLGPFNGGAFGTNGTLSGSTTLTAEQVAMLLSGRTYVNVHSPEHPGGEIRGQIVPVGFTSDLSAEAVTSGTIVTDGSGSGTFALVGDQLSFVIRYQDLTGPASNAHIHGPAGLNESAGVLVPLVPFSPSEPLGASGVFAGSVKLTPEQLAFVADGRTYVNIHTAANSGGEIRGQILPQTMAVPFTAVLNGASERPDPVQTAGTGTAYLTLEGNRLRVNAIYSGLSGAAAAAHIHGPAGPNASAGVIISLEPFNDDGFGTNGTFSGTAVITDQQRSMLLQGQTYMNIHTPDHGGGEIRGQVSPVLMRALITGAAERPASIETSGSGTGHFLMVGSDLYTAVTYGGFDSAASNAHIHGPASVTEAAGVMVPLGPLNGGSFGTSGGLSGMVTLTSEQLTALLDGRTYVNIHTGSHPGGEIRGQIGR